MSDLVMIPSNTSAIYNNEHIRVDNVYYTHDNGGRPFKIILDRYIVHIYKEKDNGIQVDGVTYGTIDGEYVLLKSLKVLKVFIGKSPLIRSTKYSGGYGDDYDGNSLLFQTRTNRYMYVGHNIKKFTTYGEIVTYISPVGNSDVPYPYAIDTYGNQYLMIEDIVIKYNEVTRERLLKYDEPYEYYYDYSLITCDMGMIPPRKPKIEYFDEIKEYYHGKNKYTFRLNLDKNLDELQNDKQKMYIIDINNVKTELTPEKYMDLMNRFADEISVEKMKNVTVLELESHVTT